MKALWAPWRIEYILGPKPDECVFCLPHDCKEDKSRLILYRSEYNFVIMNKFPYSNGHLLVTPYRHVYGLDELEPKECHELIDLVRQCTTILNQAFHPDGINVGLNLGEAAGAGIEEHLHFHLVPRWTGDHSFMAIFGQTQIIPEHLQSTYTRLKPYFNALTNS